MRTPLLRRSMRRAAAPIAAPHIAAHVLRGGLLLASIVNGRPARAASAARPR
jgi:hypothetical protein